MCATTNPTSTTPVRAITTFFPIVEPKKLASRCISAPGGVGGASRSAARASTRRFYLRRILLTMSGGGNDAPRRAKEKTQQQALEGGLGVDPMMLGVAEDGLRHLAVARARVGVIGAGQMGA